MSKKLLLLNGLAIIGIALNHANAYGMQAMFYWTDRYLPVQVPNFDQLDSPAYFVTLLLRQLVIFTVPAFLFISGFFIAFMARGDKARVTVQTVWPRIKVLLFPFLVWTVIRYILLRQFPASVDDVLDPYHFVPLLIQFYLLSPLLVPLAKSNWKLLLAIAAVIHLANQSLNYINALGLTFPGKEIVDLLTPRWVFYSQLPFWFPFGLVVGLHLGKFQAWIGKYKTALLVITLVLGAAMVGEYFLFDTLNGEVWLNPTFSGITKTLFTLGFILWYLASDERLMPFSKAISTISAKSLGIYLANIPSVYIVAVLLYRLAPSVLGMPYLYQPLLFMAGFFGPLLLMLLIQKSPARPIYRYIFG